jgi:hypothetical protein
MFRRGSMIRKTRVPTFRPDMHPALEEETKRLCERERCVAAARARSMSALLQLVQRQHDPLAYETQADHDEGREGDYR